MIIKQASSDRILFDSTHDLFVDGKRLKASDYYVEHTLSGVIYRVYFDRAGVHIHTECDRDTVMQLEPDQIASNPAVRVKVKPIP